LIAELHGVPLRREDARFITGSGRFVADINLPGQLHCAFVRSPHAYAQINSIDTQAVGKEQQLSQDQVKDLVQNNPELTETERQKVLDNLTKIVLAQNRRVDITLTTTGQQSVKLYPFNAQDSITLLDEKATASKHTHNSTKHVHAKK